MTLDINSMSDLSMDIPEDLFTESDSQPQEPAESAPQENVEESSSDFFGDSSEQPIDENPSSDVADPLTITTKVNGKEEIIDLRNPETQEKLKQIWSLEKAARQAISDKGRLGKELKELKKQLEENKLDDNTKNIIKILHAQKGDIRSLFQTLTGNDFDSYVEEAINRKKAFEGMSESERALYNMKEKLEQQDYKLSKFQTEIEEKNKAIADKEASIAQKEMFNLIAPVFEEHAVIFDGLPEATENSFRKALWRDTLDLLSRVEARGEKLTQKLIKKAVASKAKVFSNAIANKAVQETETIINDKKETAKKNLALAAKEGTSNLSMKDLKNKGAMELFRIMTGGK
jgi:hypothetical protein